DGRPLRPGRGRVSPGGAGGPVEHARRTATLPRSPDPLLPGGSRAAPRPASDRTGGFPGRPGSPVQPGPAGPRPWVPGPGLVRPEVERGVRARGLPPAVLLGRRGRCPRVGGRRVPRQRTGGLL